MVIVLQVPYMVIDLSESIAHAFKQEKGSGHLSVCLRDYLE